MLSVRHTIFKSLYALCILWGFSLHFMPGYYIQVNASAPGSTASDICISFVYQLQDALHRFQVSYIQVNASGPGISHPGGCIRSWYHRISYMHQLCVSAPGCFISVPGILHPGICIRPGIIASRWMHQILEPSHQKKPPAFCPLKKHKKNNSLWLYMIMCISQITKNVKKCPFRYLWNDIMIK